VLFCSARTSSSARTSVGSPAARKPARVGWRMPRTRRHQWRRACSEGPVTHPWGRNCFRAFPNAVAPPHPRSLPGRGGVRYPMSGVKILFDGRACSTLARETTASSGAGGPPRWGCLHQLRRAAPNVEFLAVNDRAVPAKYMKMITPAALLRCLIRGGPTRCTSTLDNRRGRRAASVQRMIEIGQPGGGE